LNPVIAGAAMALSALSVVANTLRGRRFCSAASGGRCLTKTCLTLLTDARSSSATFVFADIAGFTALTEAYGDEEAANLPASNLTRLPPRRAQVRPPECR
jgi:class 3 adenylate cyclase